MHYDLIGAPTMLKDRNILLQVKYITSVCINLVANSSTKYFNAKLYIAIYIPLITIACPLLILIFISLLVQNATTLMHYSEAFLRSKPRKSLLFQKKKYISQWIFAIFYCQLLSGELDCNHPMKSKKDTYSLGHHKSTSIWVRLIIAIHNPSWLTCC